MNKQDIILIGKLQQLKGIQPKSEWRVLFKEKLNAEMGFVKAEARNKSREFSLITETKRFVSASKIKEILAFSGSLSFSRTSFAGAAIALFLMISGGTMISYATATSLPGDRFYSLKLATEKVKFALAPDEEKRFVLRFEFINARLAEMGAAMDINESEDMKTDRVTVAVNAIKNEINSINADFDKFDKKIGNSEPAKSVKVAKSIDETMNNYGKTLTAAVVRLPVSIKEKTKANISETMKVAEETSYKTLLVLVERRNEASVMTNEELAQRVEQKIVNAEAKLKDVQDKAQVLANNQAEINTSSETAAKDQITGGNSSNAEKQETKDTASDILSNEAHAMLADARIKLQTNDLSGALKTATASESIVSATENIIGAAVTANPTSTVAADEIVDKPVAENNPASVPIENPLIPLKTITPSAVLTPTPNNLP